MGIVVRREWANKIFENPMKEPTSQQYHQPAVHGAPLNTGGESTGGDHTGGEAVRP